MVSFGEADLRLPARSTKAPMPSASAVRRAAPARPSKTPEKNSSFCWLASIFTFSASTVALLMPFQVQPWLPSKVGGSPDRIWKPDSGACAQKKLLWPAWSAG